MQELFKLIQLFDIDEKTQAILKVTAHIQYTEFVYIYENL